MTNRTAVRTARSTGAARSTRWVPVALIALVVVPATAGSLRLLELAGGPQLAVAEYLIRRPASRRRIGRPTIEASAKVGSR